ALRDDVSRHQALVAAAGAAQQAATGWREPLAEADARSALTVARSKEGSLFGFLSKDWRNVKALVAQRFDASGRAVRPRVKEVLAALVAAYDADAAVRDSASRAARDWGHDDPPALAERIGAYARSADPLVVRWRSALAAQPGPELALLLGRLGTALRVAGDASAGLLVDDVAARSLAVVRDLVESLASPRHAAAIRTVAPAIRQLSAAPAPVQTVVRRLPATPDQLEYGVCAAHWERARAAAPVLAELDSERLDRVVADLGSAADELTGLDAAVVVAGVRARFLDELAHSELSATGMSEADQARKKAFSAGRRALEHEFGKVMRYKSIRELSSGDSGAVVALLRPVWLMSPSSVSDTLPLDGSGGGFDVVIYDEASQIPVEEAIPAMHRAPQVIVVGDQMQLPPTQYFQVGSRGPDDLAEDLAGELDADDAEQVGVVLTEDSFLSVSALRLASTMLTWHYRSKSEALISYSNSAFYGGRLATVPDRLPAHAAPPWTLRSDSAALAEVCDSLLAGSITAVQLVDGIYVRRTNPAEARWIAGLVRELLTRRTGKSLGIVAFSEAQQGEIERALDELAEADPEFGALYEAEQVRTHGEQDVGLFVKNLENVQGDERDIVLMSVCYAAGPDGRMLMNFGPINTSGGEKRLNVIFSRARQHMVVVSSIEPDAITNTYNDGANTLRRFLTYATAVSRGDTPAAKAALAPYALGRRRDPATTSSSRGPARPGLASPGPGHTGLASPGPGRTGLGRLAEVGATAVVEQVRAALEAQGVEVDTAVGESVFRCDLALKLPGDTGHRLAVLIDTPERLAADSLLERLTTHPRALTTTGWRVHHILTTDWTRTPD
ncbi:MAG TPA: AAA domain-containing protein, partial [Kribbellaceae bacterium]